MKLRLKEFKQAYYNFSGKASDIARYLAFAGIALVWMFRIEVEGSISVPESLLLPAILLVFALILDFFQYASNTAIWGIAHYIKRKKAKSEDSGQSRRAKS